MKKLAKLSMMILAAVVLFGTSCQEIIDNNETGSGRLVVKLTDAPFPVDLIDQALVTIDKIEIRSAIDSEDESELSYQNQNQGSNTNEQIMENHPFIVLSEETQEFNLLALTNGITSDLIQMEIGTGSYDLIRMHVVSATIILNDGQEFDLKIPSGSESGLKIKIDPELVVEDGVVNELLLDFDVSKSFIVQGNASSKAGIKGFIFKPVIRAVGQKQCSRVEGMVYEGENTPIEQAHVQLMQGDSILTSSFTDESGNYVLIGIPEGAYTIICEKEGYGTVTVTDLETDADCKTIQNIPMVAGGEAVEMVADPLTCTTNTSGGSGNGSNSGNSSNNGNSSGNGSSSNNGNNSGNGNSSGNGNGNGKS